MKISLRSISNQLPTSSFQFEPATDNWQLATSVIGTGGAG